MKEEISQLNFNMAKQKAKVEYLINWYFGTFCYKCGRIDLESENYGRKCYDKMQKLKESLDLDEMTHKEFREIIKNSLFCNPTKRQFHKCPICEKLGIRMITKVTSPLKKKKK